MKSWEKELMESWLGSEKSILKALEGYYTSALGDIKMKILLMQAQGDLLPNQVYQLQYQQALQKQIGDILDRLHSREYNTIQEYLNDCYYSGYIGTMYSVARQGIPMLLPIDQNAMIRAVLMDSKLSAPLYDALGVDINSLKSVIRSEVSRGISANLPMDEIARNIKQRTGTPLSHAKTIVRTESHRIQQASTEDARQAVKSRGCNVVKMWDSTLDGRTRDTHQQLDGQSRETDEPFEIGGMTARFPGDFGDPGEDCNCRCVALTRARAAMTDQELAVLRQRAEYFGIDKSDSFADFRKRYMAAVQE